MSANVGGSRRRASRASPVVSPLRHAPHCNGVFSGRCRVPSCDFVVHWCACDAPSRRACCYHQGPTPPVGPVLRDGADITAEVNSAVERLGLRYATEAAGGHDSNGYVAVDRLTGQRVEPDVAPHRNVHRAFAACARAEAEWAALLAAGVDAPTVAQLLAWPIDGAP